MATDCQYKKPAKLVNCFDHLINDKQHEDLTIVLKTLSLS